MSAENSPPPVLKGRIVIYSIIGCPHCLQAKSTLQDLKLPFTDVSVDRFPPRVREWVKEKTGKTSVPQIFFNKEYVGGNKEFQEAIKDNDKFQALLEEVRNNEVTDDTDPLLPSPSEALGSPKNLTGDFHCEMDEYAAFVNELRESGIVKDRKPGGLKAICSSKTRDAFTGKDFVEWVMKTKNVDKPKAIEMGQELIARKFGHGVHEQEEFNDDEKSVYQLIHAQVGGALNTDQINQCAQRKAEEVAEDLRKLILQIFASFLSPDGKSVNYKGIKESQMFETYKAMARELQRVDLKELSKEGKLSFFINIYNALVIHGNIERGTPTNTYQRYKFFSTVSYNIGGLVFSLNDIENGVLRGNKSSMATLYLTPFGKNDPKLSFALDSVEPRIHFALNCGAKSCPPIKTFTTEHVENELATATESYLENDDAIMVEPEKNIVSLSMLFKWYHSDFGANPGEILQWILDHMGTSNDKSTQLDTLMKAQNGGKDNLKIKYIPYDWGHNNKDD